MTITISDNQQIIWQHQHQTVQIEAWGADSMRVRANLRPIREDVPHALLVPATTTVAIEQDEEETRLVNGQALRVRFLSKVIYEPSLTMPPTPKRGRAASAGTLILRLRSTRVFTDKRTYAIIMETLKLMKIMKSLPEIKQIIELQKPYLADKYGVIEIGLFGS